VKAGDDILNLRTEVKGAPPDVLSVAPTTAGEVATVLRYATANKTPVQIWGGGTRQGYGTPRPPGIVMSMSKMDTVEAWDPDDLTVVVGAGASVASLEERLGERSQTAVLPERPGQSTVGGVISAGVSSLRRGRLLGTRERVLEVTLVTGDGRVVRAGGRVVKNVTGYDLPRLVVGAFGSLGVVTSACLKLWPLPPESATVEIDDLSSASEVARPLATIQTNSHISLYLWGTKSEVDALVARLGGRASPGLHWPEDPEGPFKWSVRVPPALTVEALNRLPGHWRYVAIHGTGEVRAASDVFEGAPSVRDWAEAHGGHLVVVGSPEGSLADFDPWGPPPPGADLQRRLIAQFDPARIINPGRLPAGL
jgi:glycolate oxidase FAD binding subunit